MHENKYNFNLNIIYEDKSIIVINKEAGILTHSDSKNSQFSMVDLLLQNNISLSAGEGSNRPGVVHRLDKETSGLLIFAKTDIAHNALKKQFLHRKIEKYYDAVVWGVPRPLAGEIKIPIIGHLGKKKISYTKTAKEAITQYKTKNIYERNFSLIECKILTGRTHQIRVHMRSKGCPIIGDKLYSTGRNFSKKISKKIHSLIIGFERQALHSKKIIFTHPVKNIPIKLLAKKPIDFLNLEKVLFEN